MKNWPKTKFTSTRKRKKFFNSDKFRPKNERNQRNY